MRAIMILLNNKIINMERGAFGKEQEFNHREVKNNIFHLMLASALELPLK